MKILDYLIEVSDRCIRIANDGRRLVDELDAAVRSDAKEPYLRLSSSGRELANEVEAIGR